MTRDNELSRTLSVGRQNKDCFRNAFRVCKSGWKYVEGYAVGESPLVCLHGWCISRDGFIVDPTPVWAKMEEVRYFPAAEHDFGPDFLAATAKKGMLPLEGDLALPPHFQQAYLDATRAAMGDGAADYIAEM